MIRHSHTLLPLLILCLVAALCRDGVNATEPFVVRRQKDFAKLIAPGNFISLFDGEMVITRVDGNAFGGLFRTWYPNVTERALPKKLWNLVVGEVDGDKVTFTVKQFRPAERDFAARYTGMFAFQTGHPCIQLAPIEGRFHNSHLVIDARRLGRTELMALFTKCRQAASRAKQRAAEVMPVIERLSVKGHDIYAHYALEDGEMEIHWGGMKTSAYPHGTSQLSDYSVLSDLTVFPFIYEVTLDGLRRAEDLPHLMKLKHIGRLRFYHYNGVGSNVLKDGPRIDALFLDGATSQTIADISELSSLQAIQLNLNFHAAKAMTSESYDHLAKLPNLKHLYIQRVPDRDSDVLSRLVGLKQLETLDYNGGLTRKNIDALSKLSELRTLTVYHLESPDLLKGIEHPKLERLDISSCDAMTDEDIAAWRIPARLEYLALPPSVPGITLEYARRLPTMTEREKQCFALVAQLRQLSKIYHESRRNQDSLDLREEQLYLYGGMAKVDFGPENSEEILEQVHSAVNQLRRDRNAHQQIAALYFRDMPRLARPAQELAKRLLADDIIGPPEAYDIQASTYSFTGQWLPGTKEQFLPDDLQVQLSSRDSFVKQTQRQR